MRSTATPPQITRHRERVEASMSSSSYGSASWSGLSVEDGFLVTADGAERLDAAPFAITVWPAPSGA